MRAIEFRAWDMLNKNMLYNVSPILKEKKLIMLIEYGVQHWGDLSNYKIMQCTGLEDKNGKKIYEGDIVEVYVQNMAFITVVVWGKKSHSWSLKCDRTNREKFGTMKYYKLPLSKNIKVIGDIYSTPELLEEK